MTKNSPPPLRSRIVGHGEEDPKALVANPKNWRHHPRSQREALETVLSEVGWVDDVIVNKTTGLLVDGHLRVEVAAERGETLVPVKYVELTEQEERLILMTFDPITDMATRSEERLKELYADIAAQGDRISSIAGDATNAIGALLEGLRPTERSTGEKLKLVDVTLGEPKAKTEREQVWTLGPSVLCVCDVFDGWMIWKRFLDNEKALFCPYPSVYLVLAKIVSERRCVLVQPEPYLASHMLDRWNEHHPNAPAEKA